MAYTDPLPAGYKYCISCGEELAGPLKKISHGRSKIIVHEGCSFCTNYCPTYRDLETSCRSLDYCRDCGLYYLGTMLHSTQHGIKKYCDACWPNHD